MVLSAWRLKLRSRIGCTAVRPFCLWTTQQQRLVCVCKGPCTVLNLLTLVIDPRVVEMKTHMCAGPNVLQPHGLTHMCCGANFVFHVCFLTTKCLQSWFFFLVFFSWCTVTFRSSSLFLLLLLSRVVTRLGLITLVAVVLACW